MLTKDQEYQREYHKKWYANPQNAALKKAQAKKSRVVVKGRNKEFIRNYKREHGCSLCPEKHLGCLDFHHLRDKQYNLAQMRKHGLKAIKAEIEKCVLLCRNCHAKIHYEE